MAKKVEKSVKKKVEKFKADYADIKAKVKLIKQKLHELKKEAKPIAMAADRLYKRGDKTMYDEYDDGKRCIIQPKFETLPTMMRDLEAWMDLDGDIQQVMDNTI